MITVDELFRQVDTTQGASDDEIAAVERTIAGGLPDDLKQFFGRSNGFEGTIEPDGYMRLWPVEDVPSANEGYKVSEFLGEVVLIGSSGGGMGYGFMWIGLKPVYFSVPWDSMSPKWITTLGGTFLELVERVRFGTDFQPDLEHSPLEI